MRRLSRFSNHSGAVMRLAFSPDGTRVASGGAGKRIPNGSIRQPGEAKVWDASTGQELVSLPTHPLYVAAVAFAPDGKSLVTGCWDRTIRVWDLTNGEEMLALGGHPTYVSDVAFSKDGRRLVTAGFGAVKLWDWPSGQEILSLNVDAVRAAFVAGDKYLVAKTDSHLTLWDASPLDERPDRAGDSRD
jgi:WD40 repeat protein